MQPVECASTVDNLDTLPVTVGRLLHHKWSALTVVGEVTLLGIVDSRETIKGALAHPEKGRVPVHRLQCSH